MVSAATPAVVVVPQVRENRVDDLRTAMSARAPSECSPAVLRSEPLNRIVGRPVFVDLIDAITILMRLKRSLKFATASVGFYARLAAGLSVLFGAFRLGKFFACKLRSMFTVERVRREHSAVRLVIGAIRLASVARSRRWLGPACRYGHALHKGPF